MAARTAHTRTREHKLALAHIEQLIAEETLAPLSLRIRVQLRSDDEVTNNEDQVTDNEDHSPAGGEEELEVSVLSPRDGRGLEEALRAYTISFPNLPPVHIRQIVTSPGARSVRLRVREVGIAFATFRLLYLPAVERLATPRLSSQLTTLSQRGGCIVAQLDLLQVRAESQVNRFGQLLLLQVVRILRAIGVSCILTYADHLALGFFTGFGFTSEIAVASRWLGSNLVHYTESTLMQLDLDDPSIRLP